MYGGLYQWNQAMCGLASSPSGTQGICPAGWHIPSNDEWTTLERAICTATNCEVSFPYDSTSIGWRGSDEGGKLKESGTTHWYSPNTGATNSTGFTAIPTGYLEIDNTFRVNTWLTAFWSSVESNSTHAFVRKLMYQEPRISRGPDYKTTGFSVRCLKD
jgi:uncharacterized protein (TIGR02145 family)